jgi:ribose transport system substrate-binding protein
VKLLKSFLLALIILSLVLIGCGKKEGRKSSKVIGVTLLTRAHLFYKELEEGLLAAAAQNNYELIITAAEFDLGRQSSQIEDFVARRVDAIIVSPADSRGVGPAIAKANQAKIPVFTADIASQEGDVVCHIASDNLAGGRQAGEYLAKILKGKGNIAIIDQPTLTSVLDRVQGLKNALAQYPGLRIVADVNGEGVRDKAMQVASDILQAHPDLNGIFGINDDSALGALDAVQQFNRSGIFIVGYDATPPAVDAILKDTALKADVVQYPRKIGETTIEKIKEHFSGVTLQKVIPVEVGIVDRDSLSKAQTR